MFPYEVEKMTYQRHLSLFGHSALHFEPEIYFDCRIDCSENSLSLDLKQRTYWLSMMAVGFDQIDWVLTDPTETD